MRILTLLGLGFLLAIGPAALAEDLPSSSPPLLSSESDAGNAGASGVRVFRLPKGFDTDAGVAPAPKPPLPRWTFPVTFEATEAKTFRRRDVDAVTQLLIDGEAAHAQASLLRVVATGNFEIFPHRNQLATEVLLVLEGKVRVRGAPRDYTDLEAGDAVYLAPGVPHGLFLTGEKSAPSTLLIFYTPSGPEQAFHGPARSDREVLPLTPAELRHPDAHPPAPTVVRLKDATDVRVANSQAALRLYFLGSRVPARKASLGWLRSTSGMDLAEHVHPGSTELLYVLHGSGELTLEGQRLPLRAGTAVHVPLGRAHRLTANPGEKFEAIQFLAPPDPVQESLDLPGAGAGFKVIQAAPSTPGQP